MVVLFDACFLGGLEDVTLRDISDADWLYFALFGTDGKGKDRLLS